MTRFLASLLAGALLVLTSYAEDYEEREDVLTFVDELVSEHAFDRQRVLSVVEKMEHRERIIELMTKPAEAKPWHSYRKIFITPKRIEQGKKFLEANADALNHAQEKFGVPPHIVTAIIGVETFYGTNKGSFPVVDALATLGFDYPRRAKFFRGQLKEFFILACEERITPFEEDEACRRSVQGNSVAPGTTIRSVLGSYAGAMGLGQFIPSSYRNFAIDFNGDGARDIWNDVVDAIGSVANYLKIHDWRGDDVAVLAVEVASDNEKLIALANATLEPTKTVAEWQKLGVVTDAANVKQQAALFRFATEDDVQWLLGFHDFYVITRYNHSRLYALAVWQLAEAIRSEA